MSFPIMKDDKFDSYESYIVNILRDKYTFISCAFTRYDARTGIWIPTDKTIFRDQDD